MVSCVVKQCKNNSRATKKLNGITFHLFPSNIQRKATWIAVIRKSRREPQWQPNQNSVVCSDHFDTDDLYMTNQGLRRVIKSGYPKKALFKEPSRSVDDTVLPNTCAASASPELPNWTAGDTVLPTGSAASATVIPVSHDFLQMTDELESIYTPRENNFIQKIKRQKSILQKYKKQLKKLQQRVRRLQNKNKSLEDILDTLNKQYSISPELYDSLKENVAIIDIFNILNRKKLKKNIKYTPAVKEFCLTLHYHSPNAYEYVRQTFNTCLPHPKTLSSWQGEAGLTT